MSAVSGVSRLPKRWHVSWPVRAPGVFVGAVALILLGAYLLVPMAMLLLMSFNVAPEVFAAPYVPGFGNWVEAWREPLIAEALWNSVVVWVSTLSISLPIAIAIAWTLARTNVPASYALEYMFWVAFMFPSLSSTIGWMMILDPEVGWANRLVESLPLVSQGPFDVFSVPGIVWARLMSDGIAFKVMLLTPAFRNMDGALEEMGRIAGASSLRTALRVTLPLMSAPIALVFALQLIRILDGFETEQLLGAPWGFYVYSTFIYKLVNGAQPMYGQAVVLASVTLVVVALVVPLQRRILEARSYATVTGTFRPQLIELMRSRPIVFGSIVAILLLLTALPFVSLVVGSFMARAGFFETTPLWTMDHWTFVLGDPAFGRALVTTLTLSFASATVSPILFSLIAYFIVRTRWRGRRLLDGLIWTSAGVPGILAALGLLLVFLSVPGLSSLYGSLWALLLVVILSGHTTGTNLFKGTFVHLGAEVEEAARISGASWSRTYFGIVVPALMPTMVLVGVLAFASAANATASIVLLASRETTTLSLLALEYAAPEVGRREEAGIVSLFIMAITLAAAVVARRSAHRMSVRHDLHALARESRT